MGLHPISLVRITTLALPAALLLGADAKPPPTNEQRNGPVFWVEDQVTDGDDEDLGGGAGQFQAGDWSLTLSLGANIEPSYLGSDEYEVSPEVEIFAAYWFDDWIAATVDNASIGLTVRPWEPLLISAGVGYIGGRDADDSDRLTGLATIDGTLAGILDVRAYLGLIEPKLRVYTDLAGNGHGTWGEMSVDTEIEIIDDVFSISPSIGITIGTQQHVQTFFGVSEIESQATALVPIWINPLININNRRLEPFSPGGGAYLTEVGVEMEYAFNEHWSIGAEVEFGMIIGDAADSPVVERASFIEGGLWVSYKF